MPKYNIILDVEESENVKRIFIAPNSVLPLKLVCSSCREETPKFIFVDPTSEEMGDTGGVRNCIIKCPSCKSTISVDILKTPGEKQWTPEQEENRNVVATIEVRGAEPSEFWINNIWNVESTGRVIEEVDLSEDWCDYDEDSQQPLSIMGVSARFMKLK